MPASKKRVVAIIQARLTSTRLPKKVMAEVLKRPLLSYLIERVQRATNIDQTIVATTLDEEDEPLVKWCQNEKIPLYRGSREDVLRRYLEAATHFAADHIVRITSDCPLIDPAVIDEVVAQYQSSNVDYGSNTLHRTYPRGMDVEVFSFAALQQCEKAAKSKEEREHVTPYIYRNPQDFRLYNVQQPHDDSRYRLTVDTKEDFELIRLLLETLYPKKPLFTLADIMDCLYQHPAWIQINSSIEQKKLTENLPPKSS